MSRFDICDCGNDAKALELAEQLVRKLLKPDGDMCLVWAIHVTSMMDAIVQQMIGDVSNDETYHAKLMMKAWNITEMSRQQIEVIASSILADTANSAPNAG